MFLFLAVLACSTPPTPPEPAPAPAAPLEPPPPARGSIGGEPILSKAIVMGGIAAEAVDAGLAPHLDAIRKCWEDERAKKPDLAGKVLVKFIIGPDGDVREATTRSTSLRHPPTEDCLIARVREARFPPLASGKTAIVQYPFVFPPP